MAFETFSPFSITIGSVVIFWIIIWDGRLLVSKTIGAISYLSFPVFVIQKMALFATSFIVFLGLFIWISLVSLGSNYTLDIELSFIY